MKERHQYVCYWELGDEKCAGNEADSVVAMLLPRAGQRTYAFRKVAI
jgi:hypothetical protein